MRVIDLIKQVILEETSLLKEERQGRMIKIKGHDREIPYVFNISGGAGGANPYYILKKDMVNRGGNNETREIKDVLDKMGVDYNVSPKKYSDFLSIGDTVKTFDSKAEGVEWKQSMGRSASKTQDSLSQFSKLPVYKIKQDDLYQYTTTSDIKDHMKKGLKKQDDIEKTAGQDKGLGKDYKDPDAPKRDSDYVSPNKDTRERNTTDAKDPKDAKWVKKLDEDDSDVTDDEKKALSTDEKVGISLDKVKDTDTEADVEADDEAAEAGKEKRSKEHMYLKASSFKQYAKLYPELNNPNQDIIEKSPTNIGNDEKSEPYYKILKPERFAKVPDTYQLIPVKDPYESGSAEAKIRRDLEGMTPEEKRAYMAKLKGKEYKPSDAKIKKDPDFKVPTSKSGKPMKLKGQRDFKTVNRVKESVLNIIKEVIKEETSK